uniref:Uncharacterized protein n=1 Tax=Arundo donax TaxID=35708 RepID=A0A0A8YLJ7_ARUDO
MYTRKSLRANTPRTQQMKKPGEKKSNWTTKLMQAMRFGRAGVPTWKGLRILSGCMCA